jgi:hypothetical protein
MRANPSTARALIAIALMAFGLYHALYLPGMLAGRPVPLLFACFLLQAVFGIAAGIGVWSGAGWASFAIVLLGATFVATELIEGFVLGIVPYLRVLLEVVVAVVVTYLLATFVASRADPAVR